MELHHIKIAHTRPVITALALTAPDPIVLQAYHACIRAPTILTFRFSKQCSVPLHINPVVCVYCHNGSHSPMQCAMRPLNPLPCPCVYLHMVVVGFGGQAHGIHTYICHCWTGLLFWVSATSSSNNIHTLCMADDALSPIKPWVQVLCWECVLRDWGASKGAGEGLLLTQRCDALRKQMHYLTCSLTLTC